MNTITISPSSTILHGIRLWLARIGWLALAGIAAGLFIRGIPQRAEEMRNKYRATIGSDVHLSGGTLAMSPWWGYPASQAGILNGDILMRVNDITPYPEFLNGTAGDSVTVKVRTGNHLAREYRLFYGGENPVALARLGIPIDLMTGYAVVIELVFAVVCLGIAGLILVRKSNDWLALLASLAFILALLGGSAHMLAIYNNQPFWRPVLSIWVNLILFVFLLFACFFPVGRNMPRWVLVLILLAALYIPMPALEPSLTFGRIPRPYNFLLMMGWLGAGIVIQIYYYRHSNPIQKQQTKWVVLGVTVATVGLLGQAAASLWSIPSGLPTVLYDLVGNPVAQLFKLFLPITIAIAIMRYRLWDIDIIINRTLVYGTLTASVIGIYVLVVGVLGTTIQGRGNLLISILATGLVAILVQPLRDRLQRGVNRMMYGERDDPVTVLSRLGQRLEGTLAPDAVLPSLVETVAQTLKLPYVAIETTNTRLDSRPEIDSVSTGISFPTIFYGSPRPDLIRLPLIYQSETIGQLIVAPRAPGEALSPMDRHLLENIAHQAGMAVHAVSLTADLQRSRQRLVSTREEERRRLRRDLHDGLGPNLASQGLKLAAVKQLLESNPSAAIPLLEQVMQQNQSTVADVRRLVHGLRPPALDELGLVAAVRDYTAGMDGKSTLQIEITEPDGGLPILSAAVEVAAYRIILEALTNVIRHAQAKHCAIRFSMSRNGSSEELNIEIQDDGKGMSGDHRAGVGLRSMRERAEEIGGICVIASSEGQGAFVSVKVPLLTM